MSLPAKIVRALKNPSNQARTRLWPCTLLLGCLLPGAPILYAQTSTTSQTPAPASVPAGADAPLPPVRVTIAQPDIPSRDLRQAEDAYLRGARALDHRDLLSAEREFTRAAELNPRNREYSIALAVTREHRLTDLVQRAAVAQKLGRTAEAENLLTEARTLDPQNAIVRQHFDPDGKVLLAGLPEPTQDELARQMRTADTERIASPVELAPKPGTESIDARGGPQEVLRALCSSFGLKAQFHSSVSGGPPIRFALQNATYTKASRVAGNLTQTFSVPLDPKTLLFVRDTPENRTEYLPLVEETLFIPGATADAMTEYANLVRNVFELKTVTAIGSTGSLVLRGDQATVQRVNATLADLVDSGSEVMLDLTLYEVDTSRVRTLGAATPSSVGVFPVAAEAQSLISANQSVISAAIASGALVLTSNPLTNAIEELGLLVSAGLVTSSEFTNLLGVFGQYAGLPLAGVYLGSSVSFNALLTSSDVRVLDVVKLRAHNGQEAEFRAGTRYPIETGIYSSNTSSLATAAAGLTINGTSVSSLLSQYLGSTSVAVPQIQFEDLGLTLKATPQILRSSDVALKLDLKVEALGSGTINSLPILNNRALISQVTIPAGQSALLASLVSKNEQRSIDGLPFLSELPGFQGTEKSVNTTTTELLITITPHVVRNRRLEVASQRFLMPQDSNQRQGNTPSDDASPDSPRPGQDLGPRPGRPERPDPAAAPQPLTRPTGTPPQ